MAKDNTGAKASKKKQKAPGFRHPDEVLQLFASMSHKDPEIELGVTLNVAGAVITGTLVGKSVWLEQQATAHEEAMGGTIRALGRLIDPEPDPDEDEEEPQFDTYGWLHLKDARYLIGGDFSPSLGSEGLYWRGRIADVNGWSFGTLGRSES